MTSPNKGGSFTDVIGGQTVQAMCSLCGTQPVSRRLRPEVNAGADGDTPTQAEFMVCSKCAREWVERAKREGKNVRDEPAPLKALRKRVVQPRLDAAVPSDSGDAGSGGVVRVEAHSECFKCQKSNATLVTMSMLDTMRPLPVAGHAHLVQAARVPMDADQSEQQSAWQCDGCKLSFSAPKDVRFTCTDEACAHSLCLRCTAETERTVRLLCEPCSLLLKKDERPRTCQKCFSRKVVARILVPGHVQRLKWLCRNCAVSLSEAFATMSAADRQLLHSGRVDSTLRGGGRGRGRGMARGGGRGAVLRRRGSAGGGGGAPVWSNARTRVGTNRSVKIGQRRAVPALGGVAGAVAADADDDDDEYEPRKTPRLPLTAALTQSADHSHSGGASGGAAADARIEAWARQCVYAALCELSRDVKRCDAFVGADASNVAAAVVLELLPSGDAVPVEPAGARSVARQWAASSSFLMQIIDQLLPLGTRASISMSDVDVRRLYEMERAWMQLRGDLHTTARVRKTAAGGASKPAPPKLVVSEDRSNNDDDDSGSDDGPPESNVSDDEGHVRSSDATYGQLPLQRKSSGAAAGASSPTLTLKGGSKPFDSVPRPSHLSTRPRLSRKISDPKGIRQRADDARRQSPLSSPLLSRLSRGSGAAAGGGGGGGGGGQYAQLPKRVSSSSVRTSGSGASPYGELPKRSSGIARVSGSARLASAIQYGVLPPSEYARMSGVISTVSDADANESKYASWDTQRLRDELKDLHALLSNTRVSMVMRDEKAREAGVIERVLALRDASAATAPASDPYHELPKDDGVTSDGASPPPPPPDSDPYAELPRAPANAAAEPNDPYADLAAVDAAVGRDASAASEAVEIDEAVVAECAEWTVVQLQAEVFGERRLLANANFGGALLAKKQRRLASIESVLAGVMDIVDELCSAAAKGETEEVRRIAQERDDAVNALGSDGRSALHWAVANGKFGVVRDLLRDFEASVHLCDAMDGLTPVHVAVRIACSHGGADERIDPHVRIMLDALLTRGLSDSRCGLERAVATAAAQSPPWHGDTPLHSAARSGAPGLAVLRRMCVAALKQTGLSEEEALAKAVSHDAVLAVPWTVQNVNGESVVDCGRRSEYAPMRSFFGATDSAADSSGRVSSNLVSQYAELPTDTDNKV